MQPSDFSILQSNRNVAVSQKSLTKIFLERQTSLEKQRKCSIDIKIKSLRKKQMNECTFRPNQEKMRTKSKDKMRTKVHNVNKENINPNNKRVKRMKY